MNLERLAYLQRRINEDQEEQRNIARAIAPVTFESLCPDRCNITDPVFEADVRRFMNDHMPALDTTLLDRDDVEKWVNLAPRYEVKEVLDKPGVGGFRVWDAESDEWASVEDEDGNEGPALFADESMADDLAAEKNDEDEREGYGFPFAWNTGWIMEGTYWLTELRASGFKVYQYDEDAIVAGIDGGGYSFMGSHFAPFYARLAAKNDWLIQTKDGPRRISFGGVA